MSESVFEALTENEIRLRDEVERFRDQLWKEARDIIHSRLPTKIHQLNQVLIVRVKRNDTCFGC